MADAHDEADQVSADDRPMTASAVYEGDSSCIGMARDFARDFLTRIQAVHGLPVSERAMGMVQLVVSELVTNVCKYAPGPCLLDLEVSGGLVVVTVWDSAPELPFPRAADASRVGQHGMEIVVAVCQSFTIERQPVGKRTRAAVALADDPGGHVAGRTA
ncbi:ATP-binding protein [Streptomyces lavendulocolor]|uniref:ATP-binding protein n=1 Tax=Streptomyces lavendulocolor TaxID=67316 RepID=UPI003C2BC258